MKSKNRLRTEPYGSLRKQILERDGWKCQRCGSAQNLQVHHLQFRSHQGLDHPKNLITLCAKCHQVCHYQSPADSFG